MDDVLQIYFAQLVKFLGLQTSPDHTSWYRQNRTKRWHKPKNSTSWANKYL